MARYGIPYKGSKNGIAKQIVDFLPEGEVLVDLFAGGRAITHCAMEQMETIAPKWQAIISNDLNPAPGRLFDDAIHGRLADEKRWISREDFFRLKDTDEYVRLCWSFSNAGNEYLYSREIEPWKRTLHFARVYGDDSLFREIVPDGEPSNSWIIAHHDHCKECYITWYRDKWLSAHNKAQDVPLDGDALTKAVDQLEKELAEYLRNALKQSGKRASDVDNLLGTNGMAGHYFCRSQWGFPTPEAYYKMRELLPLDRGYPWHYVFLKRMQRLQSLQSLQRLQSLESLQRLQRLQNLQSLQRVAMLSKSYEQVDIPAGAVVYCDIPYENSDCAGYVAFDHKAFYSWADSRPFQVFVSSYQIEDERFVCVKEFVKQNLQSRANAKTVERIYTQRRYAR